MTNYEVMFIIDAALEDEKKDATVETVQSIIAADGEEQDAYILGVNKPIKEFTGKVIAVIHRFDDVEEKLVVVPTDASLTKEEIKRQVDFQEQFFKTEIKM